MYYDVISSLPQLPHFECADRLPITPLRLAQRLRGLRLQHAEQLNQVRALVRWRPDQVTAKNDTAFIAAYTRLMESPLEKPLRDYIAFRQTQQALLAALRRKRAGCEPPKASSVWGVGAHGYHICTHWNEPGFGLKYVHPWLSKAEECLWAGDALGLERLIVELNWRWLTRLAEPNMFGFDAVVAFVFKWDMLQAWLACQAGQASIRFRELIEKVTHHEGV